MNHLIFASLVTASLAQGQQGGDSFPLADGRHIPEVFIRTIVVIVLFYAGASFLLTVIRMLLNHRLKSKMIGMGITGNEAEKLLRTGAESEQYAVKWFLLLLSAGIGFTVIEWFPLGWLSFGTMSFSLSVGFAAYYFFLKKNKDTQ